MAAFKFPLSWEKFKQLLEEPENEGLQLVIGIDANTKSEEDVEDLREHLDDLGLTATSVGPTTIKKAHGHSATFESWKGCC